MLKKKKKLSLEEMREKRKALEQERADLEELQKEEDNVKEEKSKIEKLKHAKFYNIISKVKGVVGGTSKKISDKVSDPNFIDKGKKLVEGFDKGMEGLCLEPPSNKKGQGKRKNKTFDDNFFGGF